MRCGHLFNGIGGFPLAAHWMKWENVMHCEIDPFCNQVMNYHFPNSYQHEDIRTTDFSIWRGKINLITGGFPCQPYSTAGKRKGTADNRHLWPEMLRAIREIQPTWIVPENVRGLINWSKGMVFEQVQAEMEAEGYEVLPFLLPACGVDAPHERYRIWFVAHAKCQRLQGENRSQLDGTKQSSKSIVAHSTNSGIKSVRRARKNTIYEAALAANANIEQRSEGWLHKTQPEEAERYIGPRGSWLNGRTWQNFPTQSPICTGDDGLPGRLADITVPSKKFGTRILVGKQAYGKWRKESLKSLGNAIVPQEAYQIFKAIQQYEDNTKQTLLDFSQNEK
jgi:DNA (cytosine-5)-methyltransferase 1